MESDDSIIEELGNVKTLDEQIYECGGIDKENAIIDSMADNIVQMISEGTTIEDALVNPIIPSDIKDHLESEVRKRLSE